MRGNVFKPQINKLCHVHFTQLIYVPHYEYEVRDARFSSIICRCFYLQPERAWTSSLMLLDATVFFVWFFLPLGSKTASEWWGWFRAIKSESKNYKDQKLNSWRCSKVSVFRCRCRSFDEHRHWQDVSFSFVFQTGFNSKPSKPSFSLFFICFHCLKSCAPPAGDHCSCSLSESVFVYFMDVL